MNEGHKIRMVNRGKARERLAHEQEDDRMEREEHYLAKLSQNRDLMRERFPTE